MILIKRKDGGVSVIAQVFTTSEDVIKKWKEGQVAKLGHDNFVSAEEVNSIPADRTFRGAWTASGSSVSVDMGKARDIHRNRMREARAPKLTALDIEQLRGRDVEAAKQVLRDVTSDPAIDSASTPEALKAVWPDVLK